MNILLNQSSDTSFNQIILIIFFFLCIQFFKFLEFLLQSGSNDWVWEHLKISFWNVSHHGLMSVPLLFLDKVFYCLRIIFWSFIWTCLQLLTISWDWLFLEWIKGWIHCNSKQLSVFIDNRHDTVIDRWKHLWSWLLDHHSFFFFLKPKYLQHI